MKLNKLIVAAAGSGKTWHLVDEALSCPTEKILITTYTQANSDEIRKLFLKRNGFVPANIKIQPWFSFLLQHGSRPYQGGKYDREIKGLLLINKASAYMVPESNTEKHYFSKEQKIFSDKLAKFVVKCNEVHEGRVIQRISRIFSRIFVDEVQDLAGYDLEILKLFFQSGSSILLVGDPRQVTYLTHNEPKYKKYSEGLISLFIKNECKGLGCEIDDSTHLTSHRCNSNICAFSDRLFPAYKPTSSAQKVTTGHDGVFLIREGEIDCYLETFRPVQLRHSAKSKGIRPDFPVFNFGDAKGLSFDRVLIFPTSDMQKWLRNKNHELAFQTRAKFYVAITRARYSVGIVDNFRDTETIPGVGKWGN